MHMVIYVISDFLVQYGRNQSSAGEPADRAGAEKSGGYLAR